jgi:enoyl-CoA hydratase
MPTRVTLTRQEDTAYITLASERAGKPATLDLDVLAQLEECLHEIQDRLDELRALILRSDSQRYFVVGADINALETLNADTIVPWIERGHAVFDQLEDLPLPTVARVDGYTLGGGLELAMACDLIVASDSAHFGQPEAGLGFVAGWGGTHRLPQRIGIARAKALLFSARIVDAEEAYRLGLVDFVGDTEAVDAYLADLLQGIRTCSPLALAEMKQLANKSPSLDRRANCRAEVVASVRCVSSPDTMTRVRAFLERRRRNR